MRRRKPRNNRIVPRLRAGLAVLLATLVIAAGWQAARHGYELATAVWEFERNGDLYPLARLGPRARLAVPLLAKSLRDGNHGSAIALAIIGGEAAEDAIIEGIKTNVASRLPDKWRHEVSTPYLMALMVLDTRRAHSTFVALEVNTDFELTMAFRPGLSFYSLDFGDETLMLEAWDSDIPGAHMGVTQHAALFSGGFFREKVVTLRDDELARRIADGLSPKPTRQLEHRQAYKQRLTYQALRKFDLDWCRELLAEREQFDPEALPEPRPSTPEAKEAEQRQLFADALAYATASDTDPDSYSQRNARRRYNQAAAYLLERDESFADSVWNAYLATGDRGLLTLLAEAKDDRVISEAVALLESESAPDRYAGFELIAFYPEHPRAVVEAFGYLNPSADLIRATFPDHPTLHVSNQLVSQTNQVMRAGLRVIAMSRENPALLPLIHSHSQSPQSRALLEEAVRTLYDPSQAAQWPSLAENGHTNAVRLAAAALIAAQSGADTSDFFRQTVSRPGHGLAEMAMDTLLAIKLMDSATVLAFAEAHGYLKYVYYLDTSDSDTLDRAAAVLNAQPRCAGVQRGLSGNAPTEIPLRAFGRRIIPYLINHLDCGGGAVTTTFSADELQAFNHLKGLTGQNFGLDGEAWRSWWRRHKEDAGSLHNVLRSMRFIFHSCEAHK